MPDEIRPATFQDIISAEAKKQGIDPRLALAVAGVESDFTPGQVSPKGARGLMQLMPATAAKWKVNPDDPSDNIRGGVSELKALLGEHKGDVVMALRRYNASPGADPSLTDPYVQKVLSRLQSSPKPLNTGASTGGVSAASSGQPPPAPSARPGAVHTTSPPAPRSVFAGINQERFTDPIHQPPPVPSFLQAFNPTERQGRRNWAGAAGAFAGGIAGGLLTKSPQGIAGGARLGTGIVGGLATAIGAGVGGATEELGEQVVHGEPITILPGTNTDRPSAIGAGGQQAAYEVGGQTLLWLPKAVTRRLVATSVSKHATAALETRRASTAAQLDTALQGADDLLTQTKQMGQAGVDAAGQRLAQQAPPTLTKSQTGRMVEEVAQGPAKRTFDRMGETVDEVAVGGPAVPTAPLRERLAELAEKITPMASHEQPVAIPGYSPEQMTAIAKRNPDLGLTTLPKDHPLPATLDLIRNKVGDAETIPFAEAHKIKRLLDGAVNWDRVAKRPAEQITKGFRTSLRQVMSSHEPYNQATKAYQQAVPLFRNKSLVQQLHRQAIDNPESLIGLIKGTGKTAQPTRLQNLFDVLDDYATQGGGAAEGQSAKDAVRAAWTHENLIKGNPLKLGERIAKVDPEFSQIMYGDQSGSIVLTNLKQIHQVITDAVSRQQVNTLAAKEGLSAAEQAVVAAKKPTDLEIRLAKSSITRGNDVTIVGDVLRTFLAPWSSYGVTSGARLFLQGPKIADLIEWMAYSPKLTQLFVQASTNPAAGMALSNAARTAGILDDSVVGSLSELMRSHPRQATVGTSSQGSAEQGPPRPASLP